jgi:hypothetical protein
MIPGGSTLLQSSGSRFEKAHWQVNVAGLVAAALTHRDSRPRIPICTPMWRWLTTCKPLDGRSLSIDGRVLFKATVAPVVMLPMASLSWTVILEVESPSTGIEVGDAVLLDASGPVSGSRPITLRAWPPDRLAWGSAGVHRAHSEHDQQHHSPAK